MTAAILKRRGFEVVGVFFDLGDWGNRGKKNAKKIAKRLKILLRVVDARKEFKKKVIDYFVSSYKKGLTPNPCVVCNKEIKFRLLFDLLKKIRDDYVATGHYARIKKHQSGKSKSDFSLSRQVGKFLKVGLFEARDKTKDQSYFLYRLAQKDLAKIIFPLGNRKKSEVKKIAKKMKLPVLESESQDICFLAGKSVNDFLKKKIGCRVGDIRDIGGKFLGKHKGLPFYTIGQRKGIEIGGIGPFWVIRKNVEKNELLVTNDSEKLLVKKFEISKANWINPRTKFPFRAKVQIRYRANKIPAIIKSTGRPGRLAIEAKESLRAATPGQSAVFYRNNEVLGGGIIS